MPDNPPELLGQIRDRIRTKHYSLRTEQSYVQWIRRDTLNHGKRHPKELGGPEVEAFLSYLATDRNVGASTQTQALSALLSPYKEVLGINLPWLENLTRAKKPRHLPVVLTLDEVKTVLSRLEGPTHRWRKSSTARG